MIQVFGMSWRGILSQIIRAGDQNIFHFTDFSRNQARVTLWADAENDVPLGWIKLICVVTGGQFNVDFRVLFMNSLNIGIIMRFVKL